MRATVLALLVAGCIEQEPSTGAVLECRAAAAEQCDSLGYGGNAVCLLVFSKECSPEDAARASAVCRAAHELPADAECDLTWR